jgi:lactate racemase
MIAKIAFGSEEISLHLPDTAIVDHFRQTTKRPALEYNQFIASIKKAERELFPIKTADLFVINDAYRPTPTSQILDWLGQNESLSPKAQYLIATGTHQKPTSDQLNIILGERRGALSGQTLIHDCHDKRELISIGKEPDRNEVFINRHFLEAEKIVVIGSVEPHYFAGFTGGRKSIIPGLCDFETTVRNHHRAVSPDSRPMRLQGNPVEEHLQLLMRLLPQKQIFSIQTVSSSPKAIDTLYCGTLDSSFMEAVDYARFVFGFRVSYKYDIILAEVRPPLDSNLYQLQKALENCQETVADGGTVILFSPCHEGIGSRSFYELVDHWQPGQERESSGLDLFGIHKIRRVYDISRRLKVLLYSMLPSGVPDKVFFTGIDAPQMVIDRLSENMDRPRIALVYDAGNAVLIAETQK